MNCRLYTRFGAAFTIALALMLAPGAVAEPANLEELTEELGEKFSGYDSWSADGTMTMSMMGQQIEATMKMQGKGTASRAEMAMNMMGQMMKTTAITGADNIQWQEMDMMGMKQVMKMDMSKLDDTLEEAGMPMAGMGNSPMSMGSSPTEMLTAMKEAFDLEYMGIEEADGGKVYVLEGTPTDAYSEMMEGLGAAGMGMEISKARLTFGVEDGFMRSMIMVTPDGAPFMSQTFSNVTLNPELDDSLFEYTPPEGVEVMDLNEMMAGAGDLGALGDEGAIEEPAYNTKFTIGDTAPDFEGPTVTGETVSLADYAGKVVLLDFWATWCGPCIHEMPNVIAAYEEYHDDGFEILGVSLDDEKEALTGYLEENPGMAWPSVYDGKGWQSEVGELYGVEAIPHTLLLDKDGVIQGVGLRGDELKEAIGKLLAADGN